MFQQAPKEHEPRKRDKVYDTSRPPAQRNGYINKIDRENDEYQVVWLCPGEPYTNYSLADLDGRYVNETFGFVLDG